MKIWIFLSLFLYIVPISAQIQLNSFEDALNYADTHAASIKRAEIGEQIAISERKEAFSYLLPSFNVSAGYNDNITLQPTLVPEQLFNPTAPEGSFQELTFGTQYVYTRGLQAQWDILNFQKMFAVKAAKIGVNESQVQTEINRFNTYNQLASTYYSILLTQASIEIYEENLSVSESILEHAKEKYQKGIISEAELNGAEIKRLQNQRTLDASRNNLEQFYIQLQSQLNTQEEITIYDTPDKFVPNNMGMPSKHPEVLWEEMKLQRNAVLLKQQKAARYPSISLTYQNSQNWATNEFFGFSDANRLPQQVFGFQISLGGFGKLSTRQKIKQSQKQLQLQQLQLESTKLVKEQEDGLLQLQLEQAAEQLTKTQDILKLQEENDLHANNKYEKGIMSLDQRLDKYEDLLMTQDSYLQSLASFTFAQYKVYIRQIDFSPK